MSIVTHFQANDMVQNIREAFIENLENVTWMDSQTKQAAKEKVRRMRTRHGHMHYRKEASVA